MLKFPAHIEIDLTSRCNYNCIYCRNGKISGDSQLELEDLKRIIKELRENGIFKVNISGGEPTIHPNFKEIIDELSDNHIQYSLTTNASMLDETLIMHLKNTTIESLFFTITSFNKEVEDFLKGTKGALDKTESAIHLCRKYRFKCVYRLFTNKI